MDRLGSAAVCTDGDGWSCPWHIAMVVPANIRGRFECSLTVKLLELAPMYLGRRRAGVAIAGWRHKGAHGRRVTRAPPVSSSIALQHDNPAGTDCDRCIALYSGYTARFLYSRLRSTEHWDHRIHDGAHGQMEAWKGHKPPPLGAAWSGTSGWPLPRSTGVGIMV